jgi:hypothetical protein
VRRTERAAAALAGGLASLVLAAPAAALAPPELFVRLQGEASEPVSDWMPLASGPALAWLGRYEIGYRLPQDGFQRVALTVTGVPDGQPTQPYAATPYCVGRNGAAGTIDAAGPELQFEGSGTYTVRVAFAPGDGGASGCLAGESTTASFSVGVAVAPAVAGEPRTFRAVPNPGGPFVGVRAPAPPGGAADLRCGRDATVQPDGSVTGTPVVPEPEDQSAALAEDEFPRPGIWTCVARGTAEGLGDAFETTVFGTPWSAPVTVPVRSDFRRRTGELKRPRAKRPAFVFTAEWPQEAQGGRASVTLHRLVGCNGQRLKLRKAATHRGRFGARRMRLRVVRPRRGYYVGRFAFAGTPMLVPSVDPNPMLLLARRGRLEYVPASAFPTCPGYRP